MKAPPLPGVMICCLSTVQRRPSCSMTCPARIRFACCFMAIACVAWELRASNRGQGSGQAGAALGSVDLPQLVSDAAWVAHPIIGFQILRANRDLAVPARDIEHVGRPGETGD